MWYSGNQWVGAPAQELVETGGSVPLAWAFVTTEDTGTVSSGITRLPSAKTVEATWETLEQTGGNHSVSVKRSSSACPLVGRNLIQSD